MKNPYHEVWVDPFRFCSSTAFQSRSFHREIFQQDFIFSNSNSFLFSSHTLAWLHAKQKHLGCKKRRGQSEAAVT